MSHRVLILVFVIFLPCSCWAQNEAQQADSLMGDASAEKENIGKQHLCSLGFGYTHVPDGADAHTGEEAFVPTLALDYLYLLSEKWAIGAAVDIEFGEYLIVGEDLNRNNAVIVMAGGLHELRPSWSLFAAAGVEFEESENLFVLRLGTDYRFDLQNHWVIAPVIELDYKETYVTWFIGIAVGKYL